MRLLNALAEALGLRAFLFAALVGLLPLPAYAAGFCSWFPWFPACPVIGDLTCPEARK